MIITLKVSTCLVWVSLDWFKVNNFRHIKGEEQIEIILN